MANISPEKGRTVGYEGQAARGGGQTVGYEETRSPAPPKPPTDHRAFAATMQAAPNPESLAQTHLAATDIVAPSRDQSDVFGATMVADSASPTINTFSQSNASTLGSSNTINSQQPQSAVMSQNGMSLGVSRASTVLPRLEVVGSTPTLVQEPRQRYEEVKALGEGGVGEVVLAKDHDIDRQVALKRLKADLIAPANVVRFVDEVRTVGQLEHPNIVPIHDVGVDDRGQFFFVMKYVAGETLESVIEKLAAGDPEYHRKYPFELRVQVFCSILQAIHYAHARGIIHRDLKPANVMIGPYGEVMVMDWGLAKKIKDPEQALPQSTENQADAEPQGPVRDRLFKTRHGTLLGTPAYMSPEQARAQSVDERSDIYSLGVIFHELMTTQHYLSSKTTLADMLTGVLTEITTPYQSMRDPHAGGFSAHYNHIISKSMSKDPASRYQNVNDMLNDVQLAMSGHGQILCHITFLKRMTSAMNHFLDTNPHLTYAGLATVTGLAGFGFFQVIRTLIG